MRRAIYEDDVIKLLDKGWRTGVYPVASNIHALPPAQPEIIHCRDCEHQIQYFYEDKRRKDGGYRVYRCELANGYSNVCLDDDFCSMAERRKE